MANLVRLPKSPRCLFCLGRIANYDICDVVVPFRRQLRGAKRGRAPTVLNVRLLQDTRGYGQKGAVVPVAPGRMRNIFYPRRVAAYVSEEQLRDLKEREVPIERDFGFGIEKPEVAEKVNSTHDPDRYLKTPALQREIVSPQKSSNMISSLPPVLQFYRIPIRNPQREISDDESQPSQSEEHGSDTDSTADSVVHRRQAHSVPIYGSVSTTDIAERVKAILRETKGGERVVVGADDITILNSNGEEVEQEADRLKMMGDFLVDIRVKKGDTVRRTVRILAQESS